MEPKRPRRQTVHVRLRWALAAQDVLKAGVRTGCLGRLLTQDLDFLRG